MTHRAAALTIFRAALDAADPRKAVQRAMQRTGNRLCVQSREYDLARVKKAFVIGFGKASATMAQAVEEILGDKITRGWVTVSTVTPRRSQPTRFTCTKPGIPCSINTGLMARKGFWRFWIRRRRTI